MRVREFCTMAKTYTDTVTVTETNDGGWNVYVLPKGKEPIFLDTKLGAHRKYRTLDGLVGSLKRYGFEGAVTLKVTQQMELCS